MDRLRRIVNSRSFLWLLLALPCVWLLNAWRDADLFYGEMLHMSGELSGRLLLLSLAITPLRLLLPKYGWPVWLLARRRYFGVAAFIYALLHTLVYVDRKQSLELIISEGMRFSMWTGWVALAIFVVLAATSNDQSVRALRLGWKKLHRWVYPAAVLAFLHWIFVAYDFVPALVHLLLLVILEGYRIVKNFRSVARAT